MQLSEEHVNSWGTMLGVPVRRCYLTDDLLDERSANLGLPRSEIVAARLPDAGATMAGNSGEILVYFNQAAQEHPQVAIGPKKWHL